MASYEITGGKKLSGTVYPQGAKNEALEVICASLLTSETVTISNIPEISDVFNVIALLEDLGVEVQHPEKGKYIFNAKISTSNTSKRSRLLPKAHGFVVRC